MQKLLKSYFFNEKVHIRTITLLILFLALFNGVVVVSYYLLPEGFLLSKNSVLDWDTSRNLILSTVQILLFNSMSIIVIVIANFFPFPNKEKVLMPLGYWCLIVQYILNGITLGTWSFTAVNAAAPDLTSRLLRTFDIFHGAGLWEMMGQLLIASATARIAIVKKDGIDTYIHSFKNPHLARAEIVYIIVGICLMLVGALIESNAIIQQR